MNAKVFMNIHVSKISFGFESTIEKYSLVVQTHYLGPAQSLYFRFCIIELPMPSDLEKIHVLQCKRKQYNVLVEHLAQWGCYRMDCKHCPRKHD